MSIVCRIVDYSLSDIRGGNRLQPGDMYHAPWIADGIAAQHEGKVPLVVVLPNGRHFCVHQRAYKAVPYDDSIPHAEWEAKGWFGDGWTVTGEAPNITVHPSIDADSGNGRWHGWLTNGVLTP